MLVFVSLFAKLTRSVIETEVIKTVDIRITGARMHRICTLSRAHGNNLARSTKPLEIVNC